MSTLCLSESNWMDWESNRPFFEVVNILYQFQWTIFGTQESLYICLTYFSTLHAGGSKRRLWIFFIFLLIDIFGISNVDTLSCIGKTFTFWVNYLRFWLGDQISLWLHYLPCNIIDFCSLYLASLAQDRRHSNLKETHRNPFYFILSVALVFKIFFYSFTVI